METPRAFVGVSLQGMLQAFLHHWKTVTSVMDPGAASSNSKKAVI